MSAIKDFKRLNFRNRIYIIFISCFWLIGYFAAFWRRIGLEDDGVYTANFVLLLVLALMCRKTWHSRVKPSDIAFYLLLVIVYYINAILYNRTVDVINFYAVQVVLATFPFLLIGLIFKYEGNENWIILLSRLAIVINIVYSLLITSEMDFEEQMNRAYLLLPSVLFLFWLFLERSHIIDLIFALVGFYIECSMGSRGPFVCVLFFVAVYLFFFKSYKHKTLMRILIVAGAVILYLFSMRFADLMVTLLSLSGKNTRVFDMMLDDSLVNYSESSGRDMLQAYFLQKLNTNPSGFGLLADRLEGTYTHNIFVELWYAYGYFIGSLIVGIFLLLILILVVKSKNNNSKVIVLLFFTASFIKLQFSGSFIVDQYFFFLIGFCINGLRETNIKKSFIRVDNNKAKYIYNV